MRKKVITILLCVLLISIIALSFVACNNQEDDNDGYVGTWVGYIEGDKTFQMYATVKELVKPKEGEPFSLVYIKVLNRELTWQTASGRLVKGVQKITFEGSYNVIGEYTLSGVSEDTFTLSSSINVLHFKRTTLNEDTWYNRAFKKTGEYTYEPYYYEE